MAVGTDDEYIIQGSRDAIATCSGKCLDVMHLNTVFCKFTVGLCKIKAANLANGPSPSKRATAQCWVALPLR